jgi:DNA-binding response OmpR family regulator
MNPILIINDDSKLLGEITSVLKDGGYYHIAASSGSQALTLASGYDFALVLLDLKLPDIDGDELYDKLLLSEAHYELPIVALVDGMNAAEVKVLNRLVPKRRVTLFSKPLKREWLEEVFSRYGHKKR